MVAIYTKSLSKKKECRLKTMQAYKKAYDCKTLYLSSAWIL